MEGSCRVLLVPFPINLLTAFAHFLYRKFKVLETGVQVRYRKSPGGEEQPLYFGNGMVWNLSAHKLGSELEELIARHAGGNDRRMLRRLLTFCQSGAPTKRQRLARWIIECSIALDHPRLVLEEAGTYFTRCVNDGVDLWEKELPLPPSVPLPDKPHYPTPPDKRILTLPVFKSLGPDTKEVKPGETEVVASAHCKLSEGRAWELRSSHVGVMIGGPAGSGKSTLTASLVAELRNLIESLATGVGWDGFSLTVECVNLDLATPTVEAITAGTAKKDREALARLKQPWTVELALQGLQRFAEAKERSHLTFVDLPGGPIDAITEITAAFADVAILITHDWDKMGEWHRFINQMGITLVSQARSRSANEGFSSVVTRYHPGRIIAGRVAGLDRVDRSWDRFISWLAEFLLFDILPSFVSGRREKLEHLKLALS